MISTRLASPCAPLGLAPTDRRNRVDPVKLLALIQRIKTASASTGQTRASPKPNTSAKAG